MNVLLLSNLFPTSRDATRGIFVAQLAKSIAKTARVHALVPLPWIPNNALAEKVVSAENRSLIGLEDAMNFGNVSASYVRYPMIPKLTRSWQPELMYMGAVRAARSLHERIRFDVVNAHWLDPDGVAGERIARELNLPLVLSARGCDVNLYMQDEQRRGRILRAISGANAVTTVSAGLKECLVKEGVAPGLVSVIGNGVDSLRFFPRDRAECRKALGLSLDRPLIVCISRLSDEKGVDVLLRSFAQLAGDFPSAQLALVGSGPMDNELRELANSLGIADRVRFVGAVAHDQVAMWLGAAHFSCMPSLREGYPNAAMEALACGRPIVASRVGALPEMINPENGILVPPGDADALSGGLRKALSADWDTAAIVSSVDGSTWDAAAAKYLDVYQNAVRSRRLKAAA
jgi:teichuronic acid biosynthesis glycosyltransferase TuaC